MPGHPDMEIIEHLFCNKCQKKFTKESALKYHKVMCTKTPTVSKEGRRRVKDFFPSSDDDNKIELLFFSEKNMELQSKEDIINDLKEKLGDIVTEFEGKPIAPEDDRNKITKRRKQRKDNSKREETRRRREDRHKQKRLHSAGGHKGSTIQCDCCPKFARKSSPPLESGSVILEPVSPSPTSTILPPSLRAPYSSSSSDEGSPAINTFCQENFYILPGNLMPSLNPNPTSHNTEQITFNCY